MHILLRRLFFFKGWKNEYGLISQRPDLHRRYVMIVGDNPIENPEEDAIGRISDAQNFVQHVLALDAKKGIVVGVLGPWGSGKTSFINLARNEFEKEEVPILDFNPWMFSGAAQLVESFFIELAAQLRGRRKVRRDLAEIGEST
ncbi:MAG: hypothetical protein F4049_15735 [Gemmatimonadetes bacterium]|nr:hypothetical protein [Gemmatimonadota bacterium]